MAAPLTAERLAEIEAHSRDHYNALLIDERPNSAIAHRAELLGEVKRLQNIEADRDAKWGLLVRTRVELALLRGSITFEQIAACRIEAGHAPGAFSVEKVQAAMRGHRNFRPLDLAIIADATGTSVQWLLGDDESWMTLRHGHRDADMQRTEAIQWRDAGTLDAIDRERPRVTPEPCIEFDDQLRSATMHCRCGRATTAAVGMAELETAVRAAIGRSALPNRPRTTW